MHVYWFDQGRVNTKQFNVALVASEHPLEPVDKV